MRQVHAGLDDCLGDRNRPPLERVRRFFEMTRQSYRDEGYLGCLMGGLGQELSGASEIFRHRIEQCFSDIADADSAHASRRRGRAATFPPTSDPRRMASLLVDCWEGAALRSRLRGNDSPLTAMLDFFFQSAAGR